MKVMEKSGEAKKTLQVTKGGDQQVQRKRKEMRVTCPREEDYKISSWVSASGELG